MVLNAKQAIARRIRIALSMALAAAAFAASAEPLAVVGILQGGAIVVRQTVRHALAEGAALNEGDIVETTPGAFAQIEFEDGVIVSLGEGSRVILKPRLQNLKPPLAPRLYMIEGWAKATPAKGEVGLLTPRAEVVLSGGPIVLKLDSKALAVFAEKAGARVVQRDGARQSTTLKTGEYLTLASGAERVAVAPRMSGEFLQALPRLFRDALPARAELFAKRNPVMKAIGPAEYEQVKAWLQAEPALRLPMYRQWIGRSSDKEFRAGLVANLNAHREWERILFPERFLPKKPPPPRPPAEPASAASST